MSPGACPNEPTFNLRGNVGTYGQVDAVATASYPIADMFRVGASVARLTRDGFGKNFTTDDDNYNKDVLAGRVSAEIGRDDSAMLRLSADYTKDKSNTARRPPADPRPAQPARRCSTMNSTRAAALLDPKQKVVSKGVAAHGQIEVTDGLTLKSITAYRKDKSTTPIDFDALPAVDVDVPGDLQEQAVQPGSAARGRSRSAVGRRRRLLSRCRRRHRVRRPSVHLNACSPG